MEPRAGPARDGGDSRGQQDRLGRGEEPGREGFKGDVRNDAAYVKGPKSRFVMAICARRIADKRASADNETFVTGAGIARMVYDRFEGR